MSDLDSDRDDVPRRFRRTSSCGPERTCGCTDCRSCFPNATSDDKGDSSDYFDEVRTVFGALKLSVAKADSVSSSLALISRGMNMLSIALETLEEERAAEEAEDDAHGKRVAGWLEELRVARAEAKALRAELTTLKHVHRPVATSEVL